MKHKVAGGREPSDGESWWSRVSGDAAYCVVGVGGFSYAFVKALGHEEYDLRTPPILLFDAFLATAVAFGYAWHGKILEGKKGALRCLLYGLCSAAVFQLTVPVMGRFGENVVFDTRFSSPDVPYIVLFAALHGLLVMFIAAPFGRRALQVEGPLRGFEDDESLQVLIATVLLFFLVAGVVRVLEATGL